MDQETSVNVLDVVVMPALKSAEVPAGLLAEEDKEEIQQLVASYPPGPHASDHAMISAAHQYELIRDPQNTF